MQPNLTKCTVGHGLSLVLFWFWVDPWRPLGPILSTKLLNWWLKLADVPHSVIYEHHFRLTAKLSACLSAQSHTVCRGLSTVTPCYSHKYSKAFFYKVKHCCFSLSDIVFNFLWWNKMFTYAVCLLLQCTVFYFWSGPVWHIKALFHY